MFRELIETDIAAVNGHGLGIGGESDDARAVIEFDDADFDLFDDAGWVAMLIELVDRQILFAVGEDGFGEIKDFGKLVALADVFQGAEIIFGSEEIVAVFEPEPFANVFESVSVGPADTYGFFGEGHGLLSLIVDDFFCLDPFYLVRLEMLGVLESESSLFVRRWCIIIR